MASSSVNNTFMHQMQNMMAWIDSDARHLTKDEILDGIRIRVLVMAKKFIAYPHCHNFSLMPPAPGVVVSGPFNKTAASA